MKQIRTATERDLDRVKGFLGQADVSAKGIDSMIDHFIIMEDEEDNLVATLGIERIERDGLLRSLVITPKVEQTNLLTLFKSAISLAKHKELEHLYLATNKQASLQFFAMLGFSKVEEEGLPQHIKTSDHITRLFETTEPMFMVSEII